MEFTPGLSMWEKAKTYASTVNMLENNDILDESILVISELAIECYLCGIIEYATGKDVDKIYGIGRVPHNLDFLYDDAYNYSQRSFSFDKRLKRDLRGAFIDYKKARFPKPDKTGLVLDEETIKFDIGLIETVKEIVEEYQTSKGINVEYDDL